MEKYASLVGGVDPHRMDLSSMIMLKVFSFDVRIIIFGHTVVLQQLLK